MVLCTPRASKYSETTWSFSMTTGLFAFLFLFMCVIKRFRCRGGRRAWATPPCSGRSRGFLRTQHGRERFKRCGLVRTGCQDVQLRAWLCPQGHHRHDILGIDGPAVRLADDVAREPGCVNGKPRRPVSIQTPRVAHLNQCFDQPTPLCINRNPGPNPPGALSASNLR
jgi:hypothetical protein